VGKGLQSEGVSAPVIRRGVPKNFSLDPDAVLILKELSPSTRGYGRLVSELLRREDERRRERQRIREELHGALEAALCP
jgi:hypothetical protein